MELCGRFAQTLYKLSNIDDENRRKFIVTVIFSLFLTLNIKLSLMLLKACVISFAVRCKMVFLSNVKSKCGGVFFNKFAVLGQYFYRCNF